MHSCCVFLMFIGASLLNLSTFLTFGVFRRLFFCSLLLFINVFFIMHYWCSLVLLRLVLPFTFFYVCVEEDNFFRLQ
ncbi:unnamed protein product, partial [Sphagnum jensenii]